MKISILILSVLLSGCFNSDIQADPKIQLGKTTFENNCATCHGKAAQGVVKDWKKRLPNGMFPAPPLNGTAHTWHHSPKMLLNTINNGGAQFGRKISSKSMMLYSNNEFSIFRSFHI